MSNAVLTKRALRDHTDSRDEVSSRRPTFRVGDTIRLCDGQEWVLPASLQNSEWSPASFGPAYAAIIHAILEAEDESERCLAELAFAIFLLDHNYRLSPADYHRLLESNTMSAGLSEWQARFRGIAHQHLISFLNTSCN